MHTNIISKGGSYPSPELKLIKNSFNNTNNTIIFEEIKWVYISIIPFLKENEKQPTPPPRKKLKYATVSIYIYEYI